MVFFIMSGILCSCRKDDTDTEETDKNGTDAVSETAGDDNGGEQIVLSSASKALFYFNDPGHIISCVNENNPDRSQIVTKARLDGAVTEATDAGFDVFVNEIYGMVPWYPSEVYSPEEHSKWFYEEFGGKGSYGLLTYAKNGNDFVQDQLEKTHEENKLYFLSYRMNDLHNLHLMDNPQTADYKWTSKFYVEHPEYRIKEGQNNIVGSSKHMLDFQYRAVREYKLAMIYELIENYDIDGILLDFMRAPAYFNLSETNEAQRINIMTDFIKSVRNALDKKTEQTGKEYYFGVVIPTEDGEYGDLGLDIDRLHDAGVDIFIFWDYYFSVMNYDLAEQVKTQYPDSLVYIMLSHATTYKQGSNPVEVRYTTKEQFYTCAYSAYAHKADGISMFNFPFYRNWQYSPSNGLGYAPPFEIVENLKDTDFLKTASQHYFYGRTYNLMLNEFELGNVKLSDSGNSAEFIFDMTAPDGGWKENGVLKFEGIQEISGMDFTVKINGVTLKSCDYTGEPYDNPYKELIGSAEQMQCFTVPAELLENGKNTVVITLNTAGQVAEFTFVDLAIR